jgi:hypothetical protein
MGRPARVTKTCTGCRLILAQSMFGRKGQFDSCNDCRRAARAAEKDAPPAEFRTCSACNQTKPLDAYEVTTKDGRCRRAACVPCYSALKKERTSVAATRHDPDSAPKPDACAKCGKAHPEVDFKWRADVKKGGWRTECNACYNDKGYSAVYRTREREKDEAAYLARNAAAHLDWARRNPDKVKEQQNKERTDADRKFKTIRTSARAREVTVEEADAAVMTARLSEACAYCAYKGPLLNGLDRVDSDGPYSAANTVACCATCNAMKAVMGVDEYVARVRGIAGFRGLRELDAAAGATERRLPPIFGGRAELRQADAKEKADLLSREEKVELWSAPCYLCGHAPALGIDRFDADGDYTVENARPCCTDCNYMKKDLAEEAFLAHVAHVHAHTKAWVLGDTLNVPLRTNTGVVREPVGMVDATGALLLAFPSVSTAAAVLGFSRGHILNMVGRGELWTSVTPFVYRTHRVEASRCKQLITANSKP